MVLPLRVPVTVASAGAVPPPPPPPPGLAGLPLLPHPSMRDATVTSDIACAQNSRREVFGLSMRGSLCKQCARLRALACRALRRGRVRSTGSDIVRFEMTSRRFCAAAASIALACCVELTSARSQGQRPLLVSFAPATLHPGDVVRVDVGGVNGDGLI